MATNSLGINEIEPRDGITTYHKPGDKYEAVETLTPQFYAIGSFRNGHLYVNFKLKTALPDHDDRLLTEKGELERMLNYFGRENVKKITIDLVEGIDIEYFNFLLCLHELNGNFVDILIDNSLASIAIHGLKVVDTFVQNNFTVVETLKADDPEQITLTLSQPISAFSGLPAVLRRLTTEYTFELLDELWKNSEEIKVTYSRFAGQTKFKESLRPYVEGIVLQELSESRRIFDLENLFDDWLAGFSQDTPVSQEEVKSEIEQIRKQIEAVLEDTNRPSLGAGVDQLFDGMNKYFAEGLRWHFDKQNGLTEFDGFVLDDEDKEIWAGLPEPHGLKNLDEVKLILDLIPGCFPPQYYNGVTGYSPEEFANGWQYWLKVNPIWDDPNISLNIPYLLDYISSGASIENIPTRVSDSLVYLALSITAATMETTSVRFGKLDRGYGQGLPMDVPPVRLDAPYVWPARIGTH